MKSIKVAYVIFAKPPIRGFVKTRLADSLGKEFALNLYQLILKWHWETLQKINYFTSIPGDLNIKVKPALYIFVAQPMDMKLSRAVKYFDFLPKIKNLKFKEQSTGGLGHRLSHAFTYFKKNFNFIIVWGSDIACLTYHDIEKSLVYYSSACVLPAYDGGYCLLGLNSGLFHQDIFKEISWSTRHTFSMQKKRFDSLNIPFTIMHKMPDLDTSQDIIKNIIYMEKSSHTIYKNRLEDLKNSLNNICIKNNFHLDQNKNYGALS